MGRHMQYKAGGGGGDMWNIKLALWGDQLHYKARSVGIPMEYIAIQS